MSNKPMLTMLAKPKHIVGNTASVSDVVRVRCTAFTPMSHAALPRKINSGKNHARFPSRSSDRQLLMANPASARAIPAHANKPGGSWNMHEDTSTVITKLMRPATVVRVTPARCAESPVMKNTLTKSAPRPNDGHQSKEISPAAQGLLKKSPHVNATK